MLSDESPDEDLCGEDRARKMTDKSTATNKILIISVFRNCWIENLRLNHLFDCIQLFIINQFRLCYQLFVSLAF